MICFGGGNRIDPRFTLLAGLGFVVPMALSAAGSAQQRPMQFVQKKLNQSADKLDALKRHDEELKTLRGEQTKSVETEATLKRKIEEIGNDRRKLTQTLIDTAARLRSAEAQVAATQDRLNELNDKERALRQSLARRRTLIGEVLAVLQRIGLHPPPALVTSPDDALKAVRGAMVLDAVLPQMRHSVEFLTNTLSALIEVRKKATTERERLTQQVNALGAERVRMTALVEERQKQQAEREKALDAERERANMLARQAADLKDLIAKLEHGLGPAARAARQAELNSSRPALAVLHNPGRLAPAVAFASLRGKVPIPVNGIKIKDYGTSSGLGSVEKGISIATRAGAEVTSPADGWVVYAGPFRSYGQLLILNTGGGYHILLAGMERISVDLGQFVLAGEPVAVMGNGSHIAAVLAGDSSQPVLYIEFRKNGVPVDPDPWWATGEGEKVRG